jgi:hypothetical protein
MGGLGRKALWARSRRGMGSKALLCAMAVSATVILLPSTGWARTLHRLERAGRLVQQSAQVVQPAPPITSSAFPLERVGSTPSDGDGLIPNPETPTGQSVAPPSSCSVTFSSAGGATSSTVNQWIATNEDRISTLTVLCLEGTFFDPIDVWSKSSTALLEIAPAPGQSATLDLGQAQPANVDPNQFWSDAGGMSIVDSRSVEVFGLTIENYTFDGTAETPAGIYVTVRSNTKVTNQSKVPHLSACFLDGGTCSDIYLIDNTVKDITNTADEDSTDASVCNNADVDAYGIAVIAAGSSSAQALQHVVIEGNTVTGTRTGQSETATVNGDVSDFLMADNVIGDADNIGMDTIGWEVGKSQANHGLLQGNTVYDVDTYSNDAYGTWNGASCVAKPENAAGIYDDGGSYIWINDNVVWNTDQGINLDVETAGKQTNDLLVSDNTVHDDPGTSAGIPSTGTEPTGISGQSRVAGHDFVALYVDAFGSRSSIADVYIHDNTLQNESQYFLTPSDGMPVVDFGGKWSNVQFWHNTVEGMGPSDRYNSLFEVDRQPKGGTNTVNCNNYENLSTSSNTVDGNFALPTNDWLTLAQWQAGNGHGWDAESEVGGFSGACPATSAS